MRDRTYAATRTAGRYVLGRAERQLRFGGRWDMDDRRRHSDKLILVLAGYKQYLWPWTIERIRRFAPADTDVCVLSAGVHSPALGALAEQAGWSYLWTTVGRVSTVQNLAIRQHSQAQLIFKVDEDMFVGEGFFERLLAGHERVEAESLLEPGFSAPVINVNSFSYVQFLETLGLRELYSERFGRLVQPGPGVLTDSEISHWIWRHCVPFDAVASTFAAQTPAYSPIFHRFSIGAILFRRGLWESMRGFDARVQPPGLGLDEDHICASCVSLGKPMVMLHDVFAGHFAYGPQEAGMRERLEELAPGFEIATDVAASPGH